MGLFITTGPMQLYRRLDSPTLSLLPSLYVAHMAGLKALQHFVSRLASALFCPLFSELVLQLQAAKPTGQRELFHNLQLSDSA